MKTRNHRAPEPKLATGVCEACGATFSYTKTTRTRLYCPPGPGETLSRCQRAADVRKKNAGRKLMMERAARLFERTGRT